MTFDSSVLHINSETSFEIDGQRVNLSDMIYQYRMAKKYCGDDWENCKPKQISDINSNNNELNNDNIQQNLEDNVLSNNAIDNINNNKDIGNDGNGNGLMNAALESNKKVKENTADEVKNILDGVGEFKEKTKNGKKSLDSSNANSSPFDRKTQGLYGNNEGNQQFNNKINGGNAADYNQYGDKNDDYIRKEGSNLIPHPIVMAPIKRNEQLFGRVDRTNNAIILTR